MSETPSYLVRSAAQGRYAKIYEAFASGLQLTPIDRASLVKRGLTQQQIQLAGYVTKPTNNLAILQNALGAVDKAFDLDDVPGFFHDQKKNQRSVMPVAGLLVPVRDMAGQISSFVIRPEKELKNGAKYISFASAKKDKGRGSRATTHCPIINRAPGKPLSEAVGTNVRITEGILKADVATALDQETYCLGLPGLNAPDDLTYILNELGISTVAIAFDNESSAPDVLKRRMALYNALKEDYDVTIELWDQTYKGIDDALLHSPNSIHKATESELDALIHESNQLDAHNNNYIYVISIERFVEKDTFEELSKSQYADTYHLGTPKEVNDILRISGPAAFPRVKTLTFLPQGEKVCEDKMGSALNLWRPPGIIPIAGDARPFLNHIEYIVPDPVERNTLLQYFAFQVQHPGEKIHWAALVQGMPGIGKSLIGQVMGLLIGEENTARPTNEEFNENFTSWQRNCQLVIVEEIKTGHRTDLMNKLKPKITEPICTVREMHRNSYKQPNRYNFLFFTNYKDAILIEPDERRYYVLYSPAEPREKEYYAAFGAWLQDPNSIAAVYDWALNFSLEGFYAKGHAPITAARSELVVLSRSPLEDYIGEGMEANTWPFQMDLLSIHHIRTSNHVPMKLRELSPNRWAEALKKLGAARWNNGQKLLIDNQQHKLWILRRKELWAQATTEMVKEHFEKWRGQSQPGANPLDEVHPI